MNLDRNKIYQWILEQFGNSAKMIPGNFTMEAQSNNIDSIINGAKSYLKEYLSRDLMEYDRSKDVQINSFDRLASGGAIEGLSDGDWKSKLKYRIMSQVAREAIKSPDALKSLASELGVTNIEKKNWYRMYVNGEQEIVDKTSGKKIVPLNKAASIAAKDYTSKLDTNKVYSAQEQDLMKRSYPGIQFDSNGKVVGGQTSGGTAVMNPATGKLEVPVRYDHQTGAPIFAGGTSSVSPNNMPGGNPGPQNQANQYQEMANRDQRPIRDPATGQIYRPQPVSQTGGTGFSSGTSGNVSGGTSGGVSGGTGVSGSTSTAGATGTGTTGTSGGATGTGTTGTAGTTGPQPFPDSVLNSPFYKQLDSENRQLLEYYWGILSGGNEQKMQAFQQALGLAKKQADPYFAEKINVFSDEVKRSLGSLSADLGSREFELSRRKKEIVDNLNYNKQYLSAEQQAELARQADAYDAELEGLRENMASRGLSSSTIRTKAEDRLNRANEDFITSSERKYNYQLGGMSRDAMSNLADYEQQLADLRRKTLENKTDIVRKGESYLGTDLVNNIQGSDGLSLGGVSGTLLEDKTRDILTRTQGLLNNSLNI